jgi:hypothetical protein
MATRRLLLLLCLALPTAWLNAQRVQNVDFFELAGPTWTPSQTIRGSNVTIAGTHGWALSTGFGYQLKRTSAGNLWLEILPFGQIGLSGRASVVAAKSPPGVFGSADFASQLSLAGFRWMVPVHERVSLYAAAGGGAGSFNYAVVNSFPPPGSISPHNVLHGLGDFGGGVDIRLTDNISLRTEVREYVTGIGLSGYPGRQHLVPYVGIAFHH